MSNTTVTLTSQKREERDSYFLTFKGSSTLRDETMPLGYDDFHIA